MNVLSLQYCILTCVSAVFSWFGAPKNRVLVCTLANIAFLLCLRVRPVDWIYALAVSVLTWFCARKKATRRACIALFVLGLCWFKYAGTLGFENVFLPLGISFYTFKAISYLVDVRKGRVKAKGLLKVFDYVCFFPAFMAGPIHRSNEFFKELESPMHMEYRDQKNGAVQFALGVFAKLVLAAYLHQMTVVFLDQTELCGWYTILGVVLYSFEIYVDFDAYSNIAIGTARLMGFHLKRNFSEPYLSWSIPEFWKRWHISLSTWLKDYIYIPLGGNRRGKVRKALNTLIVFLVSGIWHGNTLMFVFWGLGHGLLSFLEGMIPCFKKPKGILKAVLILINFTLVSLLWIFFRTPDWAGVQSIFARMCAIQGVPLSSFAYQSAGLTANQWVFMIAVLLMVIVSDLLRRKTGDGLEWLADRSFVVRWVLYFVLMVIAIVFGVYGPGFDPTDFIYVTF